MKTIFLMKMGRVLLMRNSGEDKLFYIDQGPPIGIFGDLPEGRIIREVLLNPQQWQSIAIETNNGFIVLEMQDSGWIGHRTDLCPGGIIQNVQSFGPGRRPEILLGTLENLIGESTDQLNDLVDLMTIYNDRDLRNPVCVLGNDGFYYTVTGFRTEPNEDEFFAQVSVQTQDVSYYSVLIGGNTHILVISRYGALLDSFGIGGENFDHPIESWHPVPIPQSLQIWDGRLQAGTVVNPIVDYRLEQMVENQAILEAYPLDRLEVHFYFVWNDPSPYHQRLQSYENLVTGQILQDLPEGILNMISYPEQGATEAITVIERNQLTLFLNLEGRIRKGRTIVIGDSLILTHIHELTEERGPLLNEITRRVTTGISLDDLDRSHVQDNNRIVSEEYFRENRKSDLFRQSFEQFLANVYGLPYSGPNTLDGYTRTEFSEILELISRGLIVKYELNLNPLVQSFSGSVGNKIMNFETSDGQKLFARVRYDPISNNIYPPV